jgi:N-acetylglutamate synthase-like GNAT family acetyltransferase
MDRSAIAIREARETDQPLIRALIRAARLDPTSLHWSHFLIAEEAGEAVGIGQIRPPASCPELGSLVVREERRGEGIGEALIHALIAKVEGPVFLECEGHMVPYYERFGFREISWRDAPMPLRFKAGVGHFLGKVFGFKIAAMRRDPDAGG